MSSPVESSLDRCATIVTSSTAVTDRSQFIPSKTEGMARSDRLLEGAHRKTLKIPLILVGFNSKRMSSNDRRESCGHREGNVRPKNIAMQSNDRYKLSNHRPWNSRDAARRHHLKNRDTGTLIELYDSIQGKRSA